MYVCKLLMTFIDTNIINDFEITYMCTCDIYMYIYSLKHVELSVSYFLNEQVAFLPQNLIGTTYIKMPHDVR